jgi:hypothetical protein
MGGFMQDEWEGQQEEEVWLLPSTKFHKLRLPDLQGRVLLGLHEPEASWLEGIPELLKILELQSL